MKSDAEIVKEALIEVGMGSSDGRPVTVLDAFRTALLVANVIDRKLNERKAEQDETDELQRAAVYQFQMLDKEEGGTLNTSHPAPSTPGVVQDVNEDGMIGMKHVAVSKPSPLDELRSIWEKFQGVWANAGDWSKLEKGAKPLIAALEAALKAAKQPRCDLEGCTTPHCDKWIRDVEVERDQLRAEIQRLHNATTPSTHWHTSHAATVSCAVDAIHQLRAEVERLRVQLAGCGVAACGGTNPQHVIERDGYGWSASYQSVLDLRRGYDGMVDEVNRLKRELLEAQHTPDCSGMTCPGWYSSVDPATGDETQVPCACPHHQQGKPKPLTDEEVDRLAGHARHVYLRAGCDCEESPPYNWPSAEGFATWSGVVRAVLQAADRYEAPKPAATRDEIIEAMAIAMHTVPTMRTSPLVPWEELTRFGREALRYPAAAAYDALRKLVPGLPE